MAKILMFIGQAIRGLMLVTVVWLLVGLVMPTPDPFAADVAAVAVLAVLALIGPVRRFLVSSILGRPSGGTRMRRS